jgi:peptidyl-dipeptidase Dcp
MKLRFAAFALAACASAQTDNPLLRESALPYQMPPFDRIRTEHFQPAIEQGMAEHAREVEAIASTTEKPTFENTIVALERSGRLLQRARSAFSGLNATNTNPQMQRIQRELAPKLAAHSNSVTLNTKLFARISSLYDQREKLGLDAESKYLLERTYKEFVRAGAKLSEADKAKLRAMNGELAELQTKFSQNVQIGRAHV